MEGHDDSAVHRPVGFVDEQGGPGGGQNKMLKRLNNLIIEVTVMGL